MTTFAVLAAVAVLGALGVVTLRQPVHAALALVATLLSVAVAYVALQAHFLAAIQVIVYAGAIMVLFLFVIMLLGPGVRGDGAGARLRWLPPLAYGTAALAVAALVATALLDARVLPEAGTVAAALGGGDARAMGEILFSEFVLAFHLVGVLLLTAIVGAVALVHTGRRDPEAAVPVEDTSPPTEVAQLAGRDG